MTYNNQPRNKRIAILIENGVEDPEFQVPYKIQTDLSLYERHVAELYRTRMGASVQSAKPTTGAAMKM